MFRFFLRRRRFGYIWVFALALLCLSAGFAIRPTDNYFEISKNIDVFGRVMREINNNYVDEIEPNQFARVGIDAMLRTLDPYTNFYSASEIEDYRFLNTGQYDGIGAGIVLHDKAVIITNCYVGSPAQLKGLQAGDEILQIDKIVLKNKTDLTADYVSDLLRGQPKTPVTLKLKRLGTEQPFDITLERDNIRVHNVEYAALVDHDQLGYISLTGFTRDATQEVRKAIENFKTKNPNLKGIILDLRGNPGGLLVEAQGIANLFINRGEKIVATRGRMEGMTEQYVAQNAPFDTEIPLVVIVNNHSASASEIVAGVMQDLDRAVIVGRRSYGKGLVQTTRPLNFNNRIKLTTARYYTPSGRCIQAITYNHTDEEGGVVRRADSLKVQYKTRNGRPVWDGGGIDPDVKVPESNFHKISYDLRTQLLLFDFATQYHVKHPTLAPAKDFRVTDELYKEFTDFVAERKFEYTSPASQELTGLRETLQKEAYFDQVSPEVDKLSVELKKRAAQDIQVYRKEISALLADEIIGRYYYDAGQREYSFSYDTDLLQAIQVLNDNAGYHALLSGNRINEDQVKK